MQTFLPYHDFALSARCLDNRRLGKQRVEAKQIYLALTDPTYGWKNHPAVKMWTGYEGNLALYGYTICQEWTHRGFNDSLTNWFWQRIYSIADGSDNPVPPHFTDAFHLSHQSNLLRKDHAHYLQFFPGVPTDLPYVWPTPVASAAR